MTDTGTRRRLGALVGAGLSCALLPGITPTGDTADAILAVVLTGLVIATLTQLIYIGPSAPVPPAPLLAFAAAGFLQDALIWWLLSWLGTESGMLTVDGLTPILLAALITRASILTLSLLGRSPEPATD
ncbi:hypothetical protein ACF09C_20085 [Streptomyces sp. NPDC014870]|uniref:hypothetical protein n=1 Tax=Streptomyces sp. NPDC014870 TaxID=3364925 RepID=UPI0036FFBECE